MKEKRIEFSIDAETKGGYYFIHLSNLPKYFRYFYTSEIYANNKTELLDFIIESLKNGFYKTDNFIQSLIFAMLVNDIDIISRDFIENRNNDYYKFKRKKLMDELRNNHRTKNILKITNKLAKRLLRPYVSFHSVDNADFVNSIDFDFLHRNVVIVGLLAVTNAGSLNNILAIDDFGTFEFVKNMDNTFSLSRVSSFSVARFPILYKTEIETILEKISPMFKRRAD